MSIVSGLNIPTLKSFKKLCVQVSYINMETWNQKIYAIYMEINSTYKTGLEETMLTK